MRALVTALKAALVLAGWLVVADVAGVIACTVLDILPLRGVSTALFYVVWLVLGIFCGLLAYNSAGAWATPPGPAPDAADWSGRPGARTAGTIVLVAGVALVAALVAALHAWYWVPDIAGDYYVPDSRTHTIVFAVAVALGLVAGRFMMPGRSASPA